MSHMSCQSCPRIVILTRLAPDSCYIARCLKQSPMLDLVAVVTEERTQGQLDLLRLKLKKHWRSKGFFSMLAWSLQLPYLYVQDRRLLAAQRQAWWKQTPPAFPDHVPHFAVSNLNSSEAVQQLKEIDADLFVVYGTRILKPETFGCAKHGAINVHMGITPEYRGSKSEFWALYRSDLEQVGFTVHKIDAGIDTGGVLTQQRTPVSLEDDEISLRNKNVEGAVAELIRVIRVITAIHNDEVVTVDVSGRESRLFSTPSMWQYMELHGRLKSTRKQAG